MYKYKYCIHVKNAYYIEKFHRGKVLIIFIVLIVAIIITDSRNIIRFDGLTERNKREKKKKRFERSHSNIIIINVANCYVCVCVCAHIFCLCRTLFLSFYRSLLPFQIMFRIDSANSNICWFFF